MQDKESGFGDSVDGISFSPDGSRIAAVSGYGLWVWDRKSDSAVLNIHDPSRLNCVSFSSRKPTLAIGLYDAVKLVNLESKTVVATLERKRSSHVYDLALSPNGDVLACLSGGSEIQVWSMGDHQLVATVSDQPSYLEALAFSPDGSLLATGGHEICLRDAHTGRISAAFGENSGTWDSLRFSPDGSALYTVGNLHANAARFCSWNL